MIKFNPYLNFNGNTEEAFNFYKSVFGGEFTMLQRFKETPDGNKLSPADQNKLMHISLKINENLTLMATDALEGNGNPLVVGNNFSIYVDTDNEHDTETYFKKLATGGKIQMPLEKTFWGAYFGMVTDKFGIQWMVNYTLK